MPKGRPALRVARRNGVCGVATLASIRLSHTTHLTRKVRQAAGIICRPAASSVGAYALQRDGWQRQVMAVGSENFRAIGAADLLIEKTREINQRWLGGTGVARQLKRLAI